MFKSKGTGTTRYFRASANHESVKCSAPEQNDQGIPTIPISTKLRQPGCHATLPPGLLTTTQKKSHQVPKKTSHPLLSWDHCLTVKGPDKVAELGPPPGFPALPPHSITLVTPSSGPCISFISVHLGPPITDCPFY